MLKQTKRGFSLIELLVVIAIIGILSTVVFSATNGVRAKARDVKRKAEISSMGRLITTSCYLPDAGACTYDIVDLVAELLIKKPEYAKWLSEVPTDPAAPNPETASLYMYTVNSNGKCALYTNLERDVEAVTLTSINVPTAGGGTGVLNASTEGWNGSTKYFQVSN